MKKWIYIASIPLAVAACGEKSSTSGEAGEEAVQNQTATEYVVNASESAVNWHGEKAMVSDEHNGTVGIQSGQLSVENGQVQSGSFVIDMRSLEVTDEMDDEWKAKLKGHLAGTDFFSVDSFPEARFAVVSADQDSLTANLTIKGITRSIRVPYALDQTETGIAISSDFEIDRSEWDVRYGSGSFFDNLGDNMIKDEVAFAIRVNANPAS